MRPLRSLGRLAALAATAVALLATSYPPCISGDHATFDARTTCGPDGAVTLSYEGAAFRGTCAGNSCWAFLEAPGANAVGLPEVGEIHPAPGFHDPALEGTATPGRALTHFPFALVGDAPVAGAAPGTRVRRVCRAAPAGGGVVAVACEGDAGAACAGTLTLAPVAP